MPEMTLATRAELRFLLNNQTIHLTDVEPDRTLLDFLRLDLRMTGTKEGCAEGDCGACTVLVGRMVGDSLTYESVNTCIRFLGSLDGCHVVTIEHLKRADGSLHPIQQAMVDFHGSQCGFCTPGFVMSLYGLWMENPEPGERAIEKALQGNLCRCTGYEAIIKAAKAISDYGKVANDPLNEERTDIISQLSALKDEARLEIVTPQGKLYAPATLDDFAALYEANPQAILIAGSTDVGLWVTKFMRPIAPAIFLNRLDELREVKLDEGGITMGAGVSYTDAYAVLAEKIPSLGALIDRIGGDQIRNMGTIGGNIANGSPIGDTPPPLIALNATITLRKGTARRTVMIEDFFIAYGKQDREKGEFVERIHIPLPGPKTHFRVWKISKRREEDITSTLGAFALDLDENGTIKDARIAFGGMAATPKRASAVEKSLIGRTMSEATIEAAIPAMDVDFTPISDMRASAEYRMLAAKNLLRRLYLDWSGQEHAMLDRHDAA